MKKLILLLTAILLTQNVWASDLSQADSDYLLREIDNICGDTWCEGDYDFSFNSLTCDFSARECVMEFEVIDNIFSDQGDEVRQIRTPATCFIPVKSRADLFEGNRNTYSEYLYETVSDCIGDAEMDAGAQRP